MLSAKADSMRLAEDIVGCGDRFEVYKEYKASRANVNKHRGEINKYQEDDDEYEELDSESDKAPRSSSKRVAC